MEKVLIVDGTNLLHRAHHGLMKSNLRDSEGNPTWAIHGLLKSVTSFVKKFACDGLVVTFDTPGGSKYRKELLPSYKANRKSSPSEINYQLAEAYLIFSKLGIHTLALKDWEADDLMASAAEICKINNQKAIVLSSDRDCYQLIEKSVTVLRPDGVTIDNDFILAKYGIPANRYRDLAALRGEPSDNIPGIKGIGDKKAINLINNFSDITTVVYNIPLLQEVLGLKLSQYLIENMEIFKLNMELNKLNSKIPLPGLLEKTRLSLEKEQIKDILLPMGLKNAAEDMLKVF